jgi:hypothetical protein
MVQDMHTVPTSPHVVMLGARQLLPAQQPVVHVWLQQLHAPPRHISPAGHFEQA